MTVPSLPREGVPDGYQAVGPLVGRGDPPPVFADAEAGDHVRVALGKRERRCSEGPHGEKLSPWPRSSGCTSCAHGLAGVSPQPVVLTLSVPPGASGGFPGPSCARDSEPRVFPDPRRP